VCGNKVMLTVNMMRDAKGAKKVQLSIVCRNCGKQWSKFIDLTAFLNHMPNQKTWGEETMYYRIEPIAPYLFMKKDT